MYGEFISKNQPVEKWIEDGTWEIYYHGNSVVFFIYLGLIICNVCEDNMRKRWIFLILSVWQFIPSWILQSRKNSHFIPFLKQSCAVLVVLFVLVLIWLFKEHEHKRRHKKYNIRSILMFYRTYINLISPSFNYTFMYVYIWFCFIHS